MVKNSKIPIIVIGVGFLGEFHIKQILRINKFSLIGVYDKNKARLKKIALKYGLQEYSSIDEAISNAEAVSIVVPTPIHHEVAIKALKKGCDIFIEKPISDCIENAIKIKDANKTNKIIQIGHIERYNSAFIDLKKYNPSPKFIESHRLSTYTNRGTEVSVIHDIMIHDIDIINTLINSPIIKVNATGVAVVSDTIDIANARIEFKNGSVANMTASRISVKKMRKMRIFEKNRYFSIDFLKNIVELHSISNINQDIVSTKHSSESNNALYDELNDFALAIMQRQGVSVDINSAIHALSIAEKIENIILLDH